MVDGDAACPEFPPYVRPRVAAGFGSDWLYASAGEDVFRFTSLQDSHFSAAERDVIFNFDAGADKFKFTAGANAALVSLIDFIGDGDFTGNHVTSEAPLVVLGGGQSLIEIDADGDGVIGANDMTIELRDLVGTLTDSNFLLS